MSEFSLEMNVHVVPDLELASHSLEEHNAFVGSELQDDRLGLVELASEKHTDLVWDSKFERVLE